MRQLLPAFAVFSLNCELPEEEEFYLNEYGIKAKELTGSYKGKVQTSYLVVIDNNKTFKTIVELAKKHNQESVLYINQEREASLIPIDCEKPQEYIGRWKKHYGPIDNLDAWTYDPAEENYYVCKR